MGAAGGTQTSSPYRGAEGTSLTQSLLSGLFLQTDLEISTLLPSCKVGATSAVQAGAFHRPASQAVTCPDELRSWIKWTQWAWALAGPWNTSLLASPRLLECHWQQPQGIMWPGREVTGAGFPSLDTIHRAGRGDISSLATAPGQRRNLTGHGSHMAPFMERAGAGNYGGWRLAVRSSGAIRSSQQIPLDFIAWGINKAPGRAPGRRKFRMHLTKTFLHFLLWNVPS